jgi:hypothetical protein
MLPWRTALPSNVILFLILQPCDVGALRQPVGRSKGICLNFKDSLVRTMASRYY